MPVGLDLRAIRRHDGSLSRQIGQRVVPVQWLEATELRIAGDRGAQVWVMGVGHCSHPLAQAIQVARVVIQQLLGALAQLLQLAEPPGGVLTQ